MISESWISILLLEMYLFPALPRRDTNEIAHRLLERFGSLEEVFLAEFDDLIQVEGISRKTATNIKLTARMVRIVQEITGLDEEAAKKLHAMAKSGAYATIFITENYAVQIEEEMNRLETVTVGSSEPVQEVLRRYNSTELKSGTSLAELLKRPEFKYEYLADIDPERPELSKEVTDQVEINLKYDGYIKRQLKQVEQFKKLENKKIPLDLDYKEIGSLRVEAVQKLEAYRPLSIGQASRISGVSPADISVILVYLEQRKHMAKE